MAASETHRTIEAVWRIESARIIAGVARIVRDVGLAEELAQDALVAALEQWPESGVPEKPGAWLASVARNRAIDHIRRRPLLDRTHAEIGRDLDERQLGAVHRLEASIDDDIGDDMLRLVFTACHPLLSPEARVALTLRLLGGLTTDEIARAYLVAETTIAQRIVRAKRTLSNAHVPFEVPRGDERAERLASVLEVLYLIFNEGYSATAGEQLLRPDLCQEAIRLGRVLVELIPDEPEALGLLSLMLLHHARRDSRSADDGALIPLEEQDRTRWHRDTIAEGTALLDGALLLRHPGPYQIQAAMAALHANARQASDTDWSQIYALYGALLRHTPTPVVELNAAVALAMASSIEEGLAWIERIAARGELDNYYLLHAARADLLRRAQRMAEAGEAYRQALARTHNEAEQKYLQRRLQEVSGYDGASRPDAIR